MSQILTCAVPGPLWTARPRVTDDLDVIQDLIQDLQAIERRAAKTIGADQERARHEDCCDALERAVLVRAATTSAQIHAGGGQRFAAMANGRDYVELLARLPEARRLDGRRWAGRRLGATVVPPGEVAAHADAYAELVHALGRKSAIAALEQRTRFLREVVLPAGHGVVESHLFLPHGHALDEDLVRPPEHENRGFGEAPSPRVRGSVEDTFRERVRHAIATGASLNMNQQNHVIITRVLAEFLEKAPGSSPVWVRVAYGDGSEAAPFPLQCLSTRPADADEVVLPIALMSMRHLLLDPHVVQNWLRNREVDQSKDLAASDAYCHRVSREKLDAIHRARDGRRVVIKMYHTGFEPAVVGFYRAAVEAMVTEPWLRVVPQYFVDEQTFEEGPSWPPLARTLSGED